ncbi:hypothetical protein IZ6_28100 [Terrihabitans soli]|uniref:Uncharacterized protein n=1 Tax=Terrihabitans soli TaxID=708113 RepID=A0A6S6QWY3_9HYPH|nr:hypothetical protein IZ6_28100 [Terrihabitans soli]
MKANNMPGITAIRTTTADAAAAVIAAGAAAAGGVMAAASAGAPRILSGAGTNPGVMN